MASFEEASSSKGQPPKEEQEAKQKIGIQDQFLDRYRHYYSERTACRVCNISTPQMISIFPFEEDSVHLLRYCMLFELVHQKKAVFFCGGCHMAIIQCIKNIRSMRQRQRLFRYPTTNKHCWTCKSATCVQVMKIAENDSKQIVFHRLLGTYIEGKYMWICNTCSEVINDLNEIINGIHSTEADVMEASAIEEARGSLNLRTSPKPIVANNSRIYLSFLNTRMKDVLHIEEHRSTETELCNQSLETEDDSCQFLLELDAADVAKYDINIIHINSMENKDDMQLKNLKSQNDTNSVACRIEKPNDAKDNSRQVRFDELKNELEEAIRKEKLAMNLEEDVSFSFLIRQLEELQNRESYEVKQAIGANGASAQIKMSQNVSVSGSLKPYSGISLYKQQIAQQGSYLNKYKETGTFVQSNNFKGNVKFNKNEKFGVSTQKEFKGEIIFYPNGHIKSNKKDKLSSVSYYTGTPSEPSSDSFTDSRWNVQNSLYNSSSKD